LFHDAPPGPAFARVPFSHFRPQSRIASSTGRKAAPLGGGEAILRTMALYVNDYRELATKPAGI
jgi:hypothetical protein